MKSLKLVTLVFTLLVLLSFKTEKQQENSSTITINIDFSNNNQREVNTFWKDGITALEALQYVAVVETHPVGKYVFVSAIDSVRGVRGESAWYFRVNGKSSKKIAINRSLNAGDTLTWIYKKDVCSKTVDACK
jgi:hypothetical protein